MGGYYGEDEIVRQTVARLIAEHGSERVISRRDIEAASGIPFATLHRSLQRLVNTGRIRRTFVNGYGYGKNKAVRRGYLYQEVL